MSEAPKFNFQDPGLTEEEFQQAEERKPSKNLKPGVYDLRIVSARFNKYSENDPSWFTVELLLSAPEGVKRGTKTAKSGNEIPIALTKAGEEVPSIRTWVMVPTTKVTYNEGKSKRPTSMFAKFREFMAAIGEEVLSDKASLSKTVPKYFKDPSVLEGTVVNAIVGYRGYYIDYRGKDDYVIRDKNNELFKDRDGESPSFVNREAAEAEAAALNLTIERFAEVVKFNAGQKPEPKDDTADW